MQTWPTTVCMGLPATGLSPPPPPPMVLRLCSSQDCASLVPAAVVDACVGLASCSSISSVLSPLPLLVELGRVAAQRGCWPRLQLARALNAWSAATLCCHTHACDASISR